MGSFFQKIGGFFSSIGNSIKSGFSTIVEKVKGIGTSFWNTGQNMFSNVWNGVKNTMSGMGERIGQAWSYTKSLVGRGWDWVKQMPSKVVGGIGAITGGVFSSFKDLKYSRETPTFLSDVNEINKSDSIINNFNESVPDNIKINENIIQDISQDENKEKNKDENKDEYKEEINVDEEIGIDETIANKNEIELHDKEKYEVESYNEKKLSESIDTIIGTNKVNLIIDSEGFSVTLSNGNSKTIPMGINPDDIHKISKNIYSICQSYMGSLATDNDILLLIKHIKNNIDAA